MSRCEGDMASPRFILLLIAALCIMTGCKAGPLGPLPNVTSLDLGLKEGGCALGDVVYMPGDEFPGENACERCTCTGGGVQCAKQRCEPRPGCKALHRPDHCCPTYQCECEQEGRVYGNGEKLVDPADPCRVCYCQGGEVVCRRIACFVRDDCTPRHVPGRCCPEYDNCPLRGVTTITGIAPAISNIPTFEEINTSVVPISLKEPVKQEITIKEITPVSEIPVITEVKIKEIIPSPSIEVAEYSSSKSPLIPREVTSEKAQTSKSVIKLESTEMGNDQSPLSSDSPLATETSKITSEDTILKSTNDPPSNIGFPTQDSINSNIYTSNIPSSAATIGSPSLTLNVVSVPSSKASMVEEEDSSIFDHNPAFPPLPDDLSVLGNHEDEILTEQNMDNEHVSGTHETVIVASTLTTSTESAKAEEAATTSSSYMSEATSVSWDNSQDMSFDMSSTKSEYVGTVTPKSRENSMLNLRSVMPTEMLNVLPHASEGTSLELNDTTETILMTLSTSLPNQINEENSIPTSTHRPDLTGFEAFHNSTDSSEQRISGSQDSHEHTTSSISKSNVGTEVTSQTELSSLPIETSDQNPHDSSENITKDKAPIPTIDPLALDLETTKILSTDSDVITVPKLVPSDGFNDSFDNIETTEFVLPSFGSQEITTDGVELIKISADTDRNSAIVDQSHKGNNVLTDLINLVGDVALIGDHTEGSDGEHHTVSPSTISDSEELIPVNAGYKSKNKNWNLNSITEVPLKTKSPATKHKNVEIEDDETDSITDSPPPNDKVEPTTRRPIIDNVSDDKPENKTQTKDIEIITKSYVPTINRRPTKVIMKKSNEKHIVNEITTDGFANSSEMSTEKLTNSDETTVASDLSITTIEAGESLVEKSTDASSSAQ